MANKTQYCKACKQSLPEPKQQNELVGTARNLSGDEVVLNFKMKRKVWFDDKKFILLDWVDEARFVDYEVVARAKGDLEYGGRIIIRRCWGLVDEYLAASPITARAKRLGLLSWFSCLANEVISKLYNSDEVYSVAMVDKIICMSGFNQLMVAFENKQEAA